MSLSWLTICLVVAAAHGLFLMMALWSRRADRHPANNYLYLLLLGLILSLLLRLSYSELSTFFIRFPHLGILGDFVLYLIGPALYFYVRQLLNREFRLERRHAWHLLPLFLFLLSFGYLLGVGRIELLRMHADGRIFPYYQGLMSIAIVHISAYAILTLRLLKRHRTIHPSDHRLTYLQLLPSGLLGIVFCWGPGHTWTMLTQNNLYWANLFYQLSFLMMSLLVYLIGFYAIRRPEFFVLEEKEDQLKYRHSRLADSRAVAIREQMERLFETHRPYLDAELTLPVLAEMLEVNQVYLSQVINEQCGCKFNELINSYRVQAFIEKAQLHENANLTLFAIAQSSGFRNKTSFNRAFKKVTGTTPSRYLKARHRGEISEKRSN